MVCIKSPTKLLIYIITNYRLKAIHDYYHTLHMLVKDGQDTQTYE